MLTESAERSRSIELTSKQCDAFMERYFVLVCHTATMWKCEPVNCITKDRECKADTREAAVTAYWQKYRPDWTPPEIWDADRALEYAKRLNIRLEYTPYGHKGNFWKAIQYETHRATGTTVVGAIRCWKLKYDPDKPEPTREETAVKRLSRIQQILGALPCGMFDKYADLQKVWDILKGADHD